MAAIEPTLIEKLQKLPREGGGLIAGVSLPAQESAAAPDS